MWQAHRKFLILHGFQPLGHLGMIPPTKLRRKENNFMVIGEALMITLREALVEFHPKNKTYI